MKLLICNIDDKNFNLKSSNYKNVLSNGELLRVAKFSSEKRKKEFIFGRILLRTYLSKKLNKKEKDINIKVAKNGAILLNETYKNRQLFASISHSNTFVVIVVNYSPIGIDIEYKKDRKNFSKLAAFSFDNPQLISKIKNEKDIKKIKNEFYKAWTRKESLFKLESLLENYKNNFSCQYKIKFLEKKLFDDYSLTIARI